MKKHLKNARVLQDCTTGELFIDTGDNCVPFTGGSGGVTSWNDLKDKPFDETEERVLIAHFENLVSTGAENIITKEQFLNNEVPKIGDVIDIVIGDRVYTETLYDAFYLGKSQGREDGIVYVNDDSIGIALYKDIVNMEAIEIYQNKTVVKTIDPKYLPDDIGGGVTSWNDLEDKPFGEEVIEITWDGNLDSIEHYAVILEDVVNNTGDRHYACLVSDKTPTDDELCRLQYTDASYEVYGDTRVDNGSNTSDFSEAPPEVLFNYAIQNHGDITVVMEDVIYIVRKDNAEYNGVIFPKAGMYVFRNEVLGYGGSLSFVKEIKVPSVKTIDPKYLPSGAGGTGGGGVTSWNDLTDKPFDDGEVNTIEITWDGDTSGRLSFDGVPPFGATVYRVSDLVVSKDDLEGAIFIHGQDDRHLNEFIMSSDFVVEGNGYLYDEYGLIHVINDGSDESGIYFASNIGNAYGRVYSMSLTSTTPVKPLDEKYIPDTIARVSDISGAGGGSAMKNIITQTEDYQMSANFTVAEVKAQIEAGVCPTLYIYQVADGMYVPCDAMSVTDEEIYFNYKQLHISADGSIWYDQ